MAPKFPGVSFFDVDVDHDQALARQFGVFSIPTMVVVQGGREQGRVTGAYPESRVSEFVTKTTGVAGA